MCERCDRLARENEELRARVRRGLVLTLGGIVTLSRVRAKAAERIGQGSGIPPLVWQRGKGWDEAACVGLEHLANVKVALEG